MKKVLSIVAVLAILLCGMVTVAAERSPMPTIPHGYIVVDVIPYPSDGGEAESSEEGYIQIDSGENVTISATAKPGYKFSHWEFITGQHTVVSGKVTDPVMVITPEGDESLLIYAHFVKEGTDVTDPTTNPSLPGSDDPHSPTTGDTTLVSFIVFSVAAIFTTFAVVVILRRKQNG